MRVFVARAHQRGVDRRLGMEGATLVEILAELYASRIVIMWSEE
jgi:hypothetical protein